MVNRIDRILHEKKALMLSFDQGLEEGPKVFSLHSIDPSYIFNIAHEGQYTGIIVHAGIAEKYAPQFREVPLVVKLNARTNLPSHHAVPKQTCTVERAIKLGAEAVGYTIHDGGHVEPATFHHFGSVVEQAHDYGIPVIAWMYSRDKVDDTDSIAYSARAALELGADAVKVHYNGDRKGFEWVTKAAGQVKVLVADPEHRTDAAILEHVSHAVQSGATGAVLGKSVWQHPKPFSLTRALHAVIFKQKSPQEALSYLH